MQQAVSDAADTPMSDEGVTYDEEEIKKAEDFKDKGNEYFKRKSHNRALTLHV